ncbi:unnamed protein product, partial [marine sediment metagenome]
ISIIFVTAEGSSDEEVIGLNSGAVDYITKPVKREVVIARINNHLKISNEIRSIDKLITDKILDFKRKYFEIENKINIAFNYSEYENKEITLKCSKLLAEKYGLNENMSNVISYAASMRDIGKMLIPSYILDKGLNLTESENEILKKHTLYGVEILGSGNSTLMEQARLVALTHHEKWDGTGYPQGLSGTDIPVSGRITAIIEAFTTLRENKDHRNAWTIDRIVHFMQNQKGKRFDPALVDVFLKNIADIIKIQNSQVEELRKVC